MTGSWLFLGSVLVIGSAISTAVLIFKFSPLLRRYALARPNARSSHREPTPQGAGAAIMIVAVIGSLLGAHLLGQPLSDLAIVLTAAAALAVVGAVDDIRVLEPFPRLVIQIAASVTAVATLPDELRVLDPLPLILERFVLVLSIVWFVNLVNFMDGIDWITVVEVLPITAGIAVLGALGEVPDVIAVVALVLGGSTLGFAPFNKPVASVFLGDVGSLPIGFVIAWMLIVTAGHGHLAAALLMPLYYVADATITLLRRLSRRERVWQAHRTHYYQRATDRGYTVLEIVTRIFATNLVLVGLAVITVIVPGSSVVCLVIGGIVVAGLLMMLSRGRR